MSRKQALCFWILGIVVTLLLSVSFALINIWLMLVFLLLVVFLLGILSRSHPQLLAVFRKEPSKASVTVTPVESPRFQLTRKSSVPNVVLVSMNTGTTEQLIINKPEFTIGRDSSCDYTPLNRSFISHKHATIYFDAETGQVSLEDNGSQNGTFLNNQRLAPGTKYPVSAGDVIQLGAIRFTSELARY